MNAAIYRRYSTSRQGDGATFEVQDSRCREFADRQGWQVTGTFDDAAESGSFFERPGLLAALAAAERGEFEVLIAYDHDRFSRGVWAKLVEAAEEVGLRLVTSDGAVDTADDENEFAADVLDAAAKKYRKQQTRKSMESRAVRVREGKHVGGVAPFGHRIERGERGSVLVLDSDEQLAVERAFALLLDEGRSPKDAAAQLNAEGFRKRGARWTSRNLIQTLSRDSLDGRFIYGKEKRAKTKYDAERFGIKDHEFEIPRVVAADRFAAMQALLAAVKWTKQTAHTYPLSRRIVTEDGHTYTGRFDTSNQKRRYRCRERYGSSWADREAAGCSHKEISARTIERAVWDALMSQLWSPQMEELFNLRDEGPTDAEAANASMERLSKQIAKLRRERLDREARGLRDGYSRAAIEQVLHEIDQDIATAESELTAARSWAENAARVEAQRETLDRLQEMAGLMNTPDEDLMSRVFEAFDVRVTLTGEGCCRVEAEAPLSAGSENLLADRRDTADV